MFEPNVFRGRRRQLLKSLTSGIVLLPGNGESPMNYVDNTYPFRQDSTFLYYGGINMPGLFLVIDLDDGTTTIFGKEPTVSDIMWSGPQPGLTELCERSGADKVEDLSVLDGVLNHAIQQRRTVHYLPPYRAETRCQLEDLLGLKPGQSLQKHSEELARAVVYQRAIKEPRELAEIEIALETTQAMYNAAMQATCVGKFEREIAGLVEGIAIAGGGRLAYPCILTKLGQVLHNHHYHRKLEAGDLVVQDSRCCDSVGDMLATSHVLIR